MCDLWRWCFSGQQYQEGQAVYPNQDTEQTGLFPDGTPFNRSQNKKPHYVFVWKTWGKDLENKWVYLKLSQLLVTWAIMYYVVCSDVLAPLEFNSGKGYVVTE